MTKKTNLKPHPTLSHFSADTIAECWDGVSIELQSFLWNTIVPLYPTLTQADREDGMTIDMQGNNVSDHWKLIPTKFKEELNALALPDDETPTPTPTKETETMTTATNKTTTIVNGRGEIMMTNTIADLGPDDNQQAIVDKQDKTEEILTMETRAAEGKALLQEWKSKDKKAQKEFTQDISETGFDTRLGNLLNVLVSESTLKRENTISRKTLTANNLYEIHKGRRSSALWFVQNKDTALNIINNATKGFSSIDAVYNKHIEIQKQIAAEEKELNASDTDSDQDAAEPETDDSVIGGIDMNTSKTIEEIATDVLEQLKANDLQIVDLFAALTKVVAKAETIAVNKLAA